MARSLHHPTPYTSGGRVSEERSAGPTGGFPGPAEPLVILTTDREARLTRSVALPAPHTRSATAAQPEPGSPGRPRQPTGEN